MATLPGLRRTIARPIAAARRYRHNLPAHKVHGVREAIQAVGASLLYLPPYSPDFNPIEMAFSKLNALLRAAAARTMPDLWQAIASALKRFSPEECQKLSRRSWLRRNVIGKCSGRDFE
ncbi:hypothetical protein GPL21_39990 [Bradyrhizobium pachyrhizi]|uniref:Tc1-like transposase DDE domain-containing protein n=1 Tax=Bradyrhizobium pachyrhizi TaxID=280333 RepID=A0A844T998_9BRAD|nr:hypothetical protein [Bradyrhizobium pachyrhizi]